MQYVQANALNQAIRLIAIRHRARAAAKLAKLGLHPSQEALLMALDANGPRAQWELADGLGCEPPTVTNMVRKLEAAGLIHRRTSPTDARVTVVDLTDRGRDQMPHLKEVWHELAEETVAGLETTSVDQLVDVLTDVVRSLYGDEAEQVCGLARVPVDPNKP